MRAPTVPAVSDVELQQLGVGTVSDSTHEDTAAQPDPVVELRHVAGLTAGQTLPLGAGRFRFGPLRSDHGGLVAGTPDVVSFDLTIHDDGEIVLDVGAETVAVEGVIIERPVTLDDGDVVQLATDHFTVETGQPTSAEERNDAIEPRSIASPARSSMTGWLLAFAAMTALGVLLAFDNGRLIGISLLGIAGIVGTLLVRLRSDERTAEAHAVAVDNARLALFADIVDRRKAAARLMRAQANTPATIAEHARDRTGPPATRRSVTIASGDQPWEPPVEVRRSPGWDHRPVIDELSFLPAIPYSVDLDSGPIAIVGPRTAVLAVARHVVTTAMCCAGPSTGAAIETSVPADWRWLGDHPETAVRVLDHVRGSVGPRTVVLHADIDGLEAAGFEVDEFTHLMQVDESGRAEITTADGTGTGFVPHGVTETHARELLELLTRPVPVAESPRRRPETAKPIDLTMSDTDLTIFDTERLLVTGPNRERHRDVLATAALHQVGLHPDRALYILDRGDRALIRLAQLENCARYTTIDQIDPVDQMVGELESLMEQPVVGSSLLLAPDLWATIEFYRGTGHQQLADRIDDLITRMQIVPVAASTQSTTVTDAASFLVWIETGPDQLADVRRPEGGGFIDLDSLPGSDLTGSVARLTTLRKEETQR